MKVCCNWCCCWDWTGRCTKSISIPRDYLH